jgi:ABC-type nitrate/sulfonate/bicarbonate transport system substrate-binding protein
MTRATWWRTIGMAVAGVLALAAGARAQAPEQTRVVLGVGIDQSVAAWPIIARDKGFFRDAGVPDVDIKLFSSGAAMAEALAAGSVSLGFSGDAPVIIMRGQGLPVVVLSPLADDAGFTWLFVRTDKNVRTPKDLEGLKFGFPKGSSATNVFDKLLETYGVDAKKVSIIDMAPPDVITAYRSGQIDGSFLWEPWPYLAEKAAPTTRLHTVSTSYFPGNRGAHVKLGALRTVFSAREEFVRANPRTVDALVRAVVRAQEFIQNPANTAEYVRLVSAALKQDPEQIGTTFKELGLTSVVDQAFVDDMDIVSKFLLDIKRIRKQPPMLDWVYTAPLERAKPEWVKVKGRWKP